MSQHILVGHDDTEFARLYGETRLLSRLVDDLRELAQAEAGQLGSLRTTDLAALLDLQAGLGLGVGV
jgi:hypothetical protein